MIKIKNTAFQEVMGEVHIIPLFGSSFPSIFPFSLILLCIFNLFDLYGKCLTMLGLEYFQFSQNFNHERIEEGKKLLYKGEKKQIIILNICYFKFFFFFLARIAKERKLLSLNSTNLSNLYGYSVNDNDYYSYKILNSENKNLMGRNNEKKKNDFQKKYELFDIL